MLPSYDSLGEKNEIQVWERLYKKHRIIIVMYNNTYVEGKINAW